MSGEVFRPRIGQWYLRLDTGQAFEVTGYDESTHTIELQSLDGDWDEIDEVAWRSLPLQTTGPRTRPEL
ncbi:MAG TPA: DUF6763 family protein [Steroidobacteraceae bacterium]|nr:DUF6763 family protein [Steroidobacteraceae bacterium]